MRADRLLAYASLVTLLGVAEPAFAQDADAPDNAVETTEAAQSPEAKAEEAARARTAELEEKLSEMRETVRGINRTMKERRKAEGLERARLFDDIVDAREALHADLKEGLPKFEADEKLRPRLLALLEAESSSIREGIRLLQRENRRLHRELQRAIQLVDIAQLEGQIAEQKARVVRLSNDLLRITEIRERLGVDVEPAYEALDELLEAEAKESVKVLRELGAKIKTNEAIQADDKEAKRRLQLLNARLKDEASTLRSVIGMLEKRGVEVAEYQKAVIENTGEVTTDVLDVNVLSGLVKKSLNRSKEWVVDNGPSALLKVLLFFLVIAAANVARKITQKLTERSLAHTHLSGLAKKFVVTNAGRAVFLFGIVIALSQVGVDMGAFIAGLGIAGFIVGFALQDTLSNFASGLMILAYRPYDVGDLIEVAGVQGRVGHMSMVSTHITTLDNQQLVVPNNKIWQDVIRNVTAPEHRRVDLIFGIDYGDDFEKAEEIIKGAIAESDLIETGEVNPDHRPIVKLHNLGDSSLDIVTRVWTATDNYWDVHWYMLREVKKRFDTNGISIPFPQRDVHLYQASTEAREPPADDAQKPEESEA